MIQCVSQFVHSENVDFPGKNFRLKEIYYYFYYLNSAEKDMSR